MNIYTYFLLINPNSLSSLYGIYYIRLYKGFVISKFFFFFSIYSIHSLYNLFAIYIFSFPYFFQLQTLFQVCIFLLNLLSTPFVLVSLQTIASRAHRWLLRTSKVDMDGGQVLACLPAWASVQWPSASLHIHIHKHRQRHLVS